MKQPSIKRKLIWLVAFMFTMMATEGWLGAQGHWTNLEVASTVLAMLAGLVIGAVTIQSVTVAANRIGESEKRFRALFDQAAVGIAEADPSAGRFLRVNKRYCEIVGHPSEEILNADWGSATHPEDLPANLHYKELLLAGAINEFSMEKRYIRKDGGIVWVSMTVNPIRFEDGKPIHIFSVIEDITARKKVERDLLDSERRFRALFEQAAVGVAELDARSGRFLQVNKRYCDIVGISQEKILNTDYQSITHPDDLEADLNNMKLLFAGEVADFSMEKRLVRKDGEIVWVGLTVSPIWLAGEKPTSHIAIIQDITERKNAEHALRSSEEKFSKAFLATPSAIAITRAPDGLLLEVNEAFSRLMEYSREEVLGRTAAELGLWADPQALARYRAHMLEHGSVRDLEGAFRTKSGRLLDGLIYGESLTLANKPCLLTAVSDITELKRADAEVQNYRLHLEDLVNERTEELKAANEKLKELDQLKSMFIASMSHELRTPLNAIIGFTGMTIKGFAGELNPEQMDNLSRVYGASKHLLALINDVIDISTIEAGRIEAYPVALSLDSVVDEAAGAITPQLKEKGLGLVVEIPAVQLKTDRKRLLQCLLNLLSNAVKYTESGTITVAAQETQKEVVISVSDTGIGIAEKDLPKVFEAFERFETHLRVKPGGTGLGLYLTRKIVRNILQGDIAVQSKEGAGSVFILKVPKELQQSLGAVGLLEEREEIE